jgi:hypothetical protein
MLISTNIFEEKLKDGRKTQLILKDTHSLQVLLNRWRDCQSSYGADPKNYPASWLKLDLWWKAGSKKVVGYSCDCGDMFEQGHICENCLTPAIRPVREGHRLFRAGATLDSIKKVKVGDITDAEWMAEGFESDCPPGATKRSALVPGREYIADLLGIKLPLFQPYGPDDCYYGKDIRFPKLIESSIYLITFHQTPVLCLNCRKGAKCPMAAKNATSKDMTCWEAAR